MIKPVLDRCIIKQDEAVEKIGNFLVPDSSKEKPCRGTVIAIGEDVKHVKESDKVMYFPNSGTTITVEGVEMIVIKYGDLIAIL